MQHPLKNTSKWATASTALLYPLPSHHSQRQELAYSCGWHGTWWEEARGCCWGAAAAAETAGSITLLITHGANYNAKHRERRLTKGYSESLGTGMSFQKWLHLCKFFFFRTLLFLPLATAFRRRYIEKLLGKELLISDSLVSKLCMKKRNKNYQELFSFQPKRFLQCEPVALLLFVLITLTEPLGVTRFYLQQTLGWLRSLEGWGAHSAALLASLGARFAVLVLGCHHWPLHVQPLVPLLPQNYPATTHQKHR